MTKTLLQNIEVLSAGQNYQKDSEGKPVQVQVVNLLVTPEQAETLSLASNETRIQLVLRNPLDTEMSKTNGTAMGNLFAGGSWKAPEAAKAPRIVTARPIAPQVVQAKTPPPPIMVEVINGAKRTDTKFSATGSEANQ